MANTHGYVGSTNMSAWDVDAMNHQAIAPADVDNGVIVTLNGMNIDSTTKKVKGYEYNVALATSASTHCWLIESPEVGYMIEQQLLSDPREFYNQAGKAMSIRWMIPQVDCFEFDANCFASGNLPVAADVNKFVPVGANGKLGAPVSSEPASGTYFRIEALKDISVGQAIMPVAILRCMAN